MIDFSFISNADMEEYFSNYFVPAASAVVVPAVLAININDLDYFRFR